MSGGYLAGLRMSLDCLAGSMKQMDAVMNRPCNLSC